MTRMTLSWTAGMVEQESCFRAQEKEQEMMNADGKVSVPERVSLT